MSNQPDLQSEIAVDVGSGKRVYAILDQAENNKSDRVAIFAHGLTCQPNDYILQTARDHFNAKGYDVARIYFYSGRQDGRLLQDSTLALHANDLNALVKHLKKDKQYKKTFVVGHSYGGTTLLFANPSVDALAFWDAPVDPWNELFKADIVNRGDGTFTLKSQNTRPTLGEGMINEAQNLTLSQVFGRATRITTPSFVVEAGARPRFNGLGLFDSLPPQAKKYARIEGANHRFDRNAAVATAVCELTSQWFERHLSL